MTRHSSARGWAVSLCLLAVALVLGGNPGPARADQTVTFDGAGDAPHVSLIGDSTLTGVRWYADYGALRQFNFVLSAESCRRTAVPSCISREGYRSANVITAMRDLDGRLGQVLAVMSGYNDPAGSIDDAITGVVDEARRQGVGHVVWLTLRTSPDVDYSDPQQQTSINTFRAFNEALVAAAEASDGYLQVADWATWSNGARAWFEHDGVHLTPRGVDALTDYLAAIVSRVLAGEDVSPAAAPWTVLVPGAEGDVVAAVQTALVDAGIEVPGGADGVYGNDTMAAVAAYQRATEGLQVTGAVDLPTARALGVYDEPGVGDPPGGDEAPLMHAGGAETNAPARVTAAVPPQERASDGVPGWTVVVAVVVATLALAVFARRRYVVAQRRARRWARVHPATSPHRSVADARRAGTYPPAPASARTSELEVSADAERVARVTDRQRDPV